MKQSKTAVVIIADGTEEMEAVITIDILRRANIHVLVANLNSEQEQKEGEDNDINAKKKDITSTNVVTCSRGVKIVPDVSLDSIDFNSDNIDIVVLPGGLGGAKAFASSKRLHEILHQMKSNNKHIAAICAAPIALHAAKINFNATLTSHPSVKTQLDQVYKYVEDRVVVDGKLITSRGPATAFEFALTIIRELSGKTVAHQVMEPMIFAPNSVHI